MLFAANLKPETRVAAVDRHAILAKLPPFDHDLRPGIGPHVREVQRMSLEEIFLQVTTDETAAADAARAEAAENSTEEAPRE